jgi:hypothetical protein
MKHVTLITLLSMALYSCQKNNSTISPDEVKITVNSPQSGQTFYGGDSVYIKANVRYNAELHGCEVKITDTATGLILFDNAQHTHNSQFDINNSWAQPVTKATPLRVTITAYVDHNGTQVSKNIDIVLQP